MKRISLSFIGLVACICAIAATRRTPVDAFTPIPSVRHESAGGTVSLRPAVGRDDDDEVARANARARLQSGETGTYIQEILLERDSALARWHDRPLQPMKVWVQSAPDIDDWNPDYVDAVAAAFREWDAVELPVRFRVVSDSSDAEIHVTWIDRFNAPISGRTRWSRDDNWWIVNAGIMLAVHHQGGEVLDKSAMKAMALHEVGHLLGLDHTTNSGSIMAPRVRVRDLTETDKATVRLIYSVRAGPLR
jgi:predicted Zn-dependent protease